MIISLADECRNDPSCGWCLFGIHSCKSIHEAHTCAGTFKPGVCPGPCVGLQTCEACTSASSAHTTCIWCIEDRHCYDVNKKGECPPSDGWRKSLPNLVYNASQCQVEDNGHGLMYTAQYQPTKTLEGYFDEVKLIPESQLQTLLFRIGTKSIMKEISLSGFVYPFLDLAHPGETGHKMEVHGKHVHVMLDLSKEAMNREKVGC